MMFLQNLDRSVINYINVLRLLLLIVFLTIFIKCYLITKENIITLVDCQRPSFGCKQIYDLYENIDCDGDGFLDHACINTATGNR